MKEIVLTKGQKALVDDNDYEWLNQWNWHVNRNNKTKASFYAYRHVYPKGEPEIYLAMHNLIMCPQKGMEVDHINGNGLDNRRENLRIVTHRENCQNIRVKKTSRFPGVKWSKAANKWAAQIWMNGKNKHLGVFSVEEEAYIAYQNACKEIVV